MHEIANTACPHLCSATCCSEYSELKAWEALEMVAVHVKEVWCQAADCGHGDVCCAPRGTATGGPLLSNDTKSSLLSGI